VNNPINNHPHVSNNRRYALVHNGVVTDGNAVETRGWCDSEKSLSLMSRIRMEKTAHVMADSFKASSYAVLALDAKAQRLWAFRNEKSPCVLADMTDTIGGIVFCSTLSILEEALELCDITKEPVVYDLDTSIPYYFPINCKPGLAHLKFKEASYAKSYTFTSSYDLDGYYGASRSYRSSPSKKSGTYVGSDISNKERKERIRLLSQDETPLAYELKREGETFKTWKDYFKKYPATFEELSLVTDDDDDAEEIARATYGV
jgi:predicted glutamine amidotransferase